MDIYKTLSDISSLPEYPDEEFFLNSIKLEEHKALIEIFNICRRSGINIPFFDDFFINTGKVKMARDIFIESASVIGDSKFSAESYKKFLAILESADREKCGLSGYSD